MYKFHLIKRIFTRKERREFIKKVDPLLEENSSYLHDIAPGKYPGRQTLPDLHLNSNFKFEHDRLMKRILDKTGFHMEIDKSWVNRTDCSKKDINWHNHNNCPYTCVYYLKTIPFFTSGSMFRHGFVRAPENSLLLFPGSVEHTIPTFPLRFGRYTLAMDLHFKILGPMRDE